MIPRTVPIVCARAPRYVAYVPAIRSILADEWRCSFCGKRVKVTW